jgi:hypothetical protein
MAWPKLIAALDFLLIGPAALFMTSIFVRAAFPPAERAQQLVMWYSGRVWTLWVLLVAFPMAVLLSGGVTLVATGALRTLRAHLATLCVAAMTLVAAAILAVVALHMAAN